MKPFFFMSSCFLFFSTLAHADPLASKAMGIIGKNDCMACHSIDSKIVGPAFKDVAARYHGNPKVIDTLIHKIKTGGSGNWGSMAMAPHPDTSEADLKVVVEWVLSLAAK